MKEHLNVFHPSELHHHQYHYPPLVPPPLQMYQQAKPTRGKPTRPKQLLPRATDSGLRGWKFEDGGNLLNNVGISKLT